MNLGTKGTSRSSQTIRPTRIPDYSQVIHLTSVLAVTGMIASCGGQTAITRTTGLESSATRAGGGIAVSLAPDSPEGASAKSISSSQTVFTFQLRLSCNGTPASSTQEYRTDRAEPLVITVPGNCAAPQTMTLVKAGSVAGDFPERNCAPLPNSATTGLVACASTASNEQMVVDVRTNTSATFSAVYRVSRQVVSGPGMTGVVRVVPPVSLPTSVPDSTNNSSVSGLLPPALDLLAVEIARTRQANGRDEGTYYFKLKCGGTGLRSAGDVRTDQPSQTTNFTCDGLDFASIRTSLGTPRDLTIHNLRNPQNAAAGDLQIFPTNYVEADTARYQENLYLQTLGYYISSPAHACDIDAQGGDPAFLTVPPRFGSCKGSFRDVALQGDPNVLRVMRNLLNTAFVDPANQPVPQDAPNEFWVKGASFDLNPRQARYLRGEHFLQFTRVTAGGARAHATYKFSFASDQNLTGKSNTLAKIAASGLRYQLTTSSAPAFTVYPVKPLSIYDGLGGVAALSENHVTRLLDCKDGGSNYLNHVANTCPSTHPYAQTRGAGAATGTWLYVLTPAVASSTGGITNFLSRFSNFFDELHTCSAAATTTNGRVVFRTRAIGSTAALGCPSNYPTAALAGYVPRMAAINAAPAYYEAIEDLNQAVLTAPFDIRN